MEPIGFLIIGFLFFVVSKAMTAARGQLSETGARWPDVAGELGLRNVTPSGVSGQVNGVPVSVGLAGQGGRFLIYRVGYPPLGLGLSVRTETSADRLAEAGAAAPTMLPLDITLGDDVFDEAFVVNGFDAAQVRAFFGPERRIAVVQLFQHLGDTRVTDSEIISRTHGTAPAAQIVATVHRLTTAAKVLSQPEGANDLDQKSSPPPFGVGVGVGVGTTPSPRTQDPYGNPIESWTADAPATESVAPSRPLALAKQALHGRMAEGLAARLQQQSNGAQEFGSPVTGAAGADDNVGEVDDLWDVERLPRETDRDVGDELFAVDGVAPDDSGQLSLLRAIFDFEAEGPIGADHIGLAVELQGEVLRATSYQMDFDFAGGPGVKATIAIGAVAGRFGSPVDIEAMVQLPTNTELERQQMVRVSGTLSKVDGLMRNLCVADAEILPA